MRSLLLKSLVVVSVLAVAAYGYTRYAMRYGSGTAPDMATASEQADTLMVYKAQKRMQLLKDGVVLKEYNISLGKNPVGHKQAEGDERTPEGRYTIDWRNEQSIAHLSLHISYPNAEDKQQAAAANVEPGGNIMIHGLLNGWGGIGEWHRRWDWTNGCIAVTNEEVREIWSRVPNGTPIVIAP